MILLALLLAAASGAPSAEAEAQLVCRKADRLVLVAPEGGAARPLDRQPPKEPIALAAAADTLVAVGADGTVTQLRGGEWRSVTRIGGQGTQPAPLRVDARYPGWATIWLRGDDPGTVPGAIGVSASGELRRYNSSDARKLGAPFRAAPHALGEARYTSFPDALRALVDASRDGGEPPRYELVMNEPSPWGGRLVAPDLGYEGDFPAGPLAHVGPGGGVRALELEGRPLDFKGAIGYGPSGLLLIDGRAAGIGNAAILAAPDGRVTRVPGVEPPCAWWRPPPRAQAKDGG